MAITGKDLISWGHAPGRWFGDAIAAANAALAAGASLDQARAAAEAHIPPPDPPTASLKPAAESRFHMAIEAETEDERANVAAVSRTMAELMRTPTLTAGAVMPDACPAGGPGTIPVGGVAAADGTIHPGMHSADICCSVAITVVGKVAPRAVLDAAARVTHFGGGGRDAGRRVPLPGRVGKAFAENRFLRNTVDAAAAHFATQGDGNHFLFVGTLRSTGEAAIVTHHGSRKPGAMLYKAGMATAETWRRRLSPETRKQNAWIPFDSDDGRDYWAALQAIRAWTKASHYAIHDLTLEALGGVTPAERFWNEHNFVFRRGDAFLHGKGATPAWPGFAEDSNGLVLIPLNMAEPVLIARGTDRAEALGFCPHGAGRNYSRTEHGRRHGHIPVAERLRAETKGIDVRFHSGEPDLTELPSAYKPAETVVRQIEQFGLAEVVDRVDPYGCIMAGDWMKSFRTQRAARKSRG